MANGYTYTYNNNEQRGKMNTYEITFQDSDYTLHTSGEGEDEEKAVENAIKNLMEQGVDVSKAHVLEVE